MIASLAKAEEDQNAQALGTVSGRVYLQQGPPKFIPTLWDFVGVERVNELLTQGDFNGDGNYDLIVLSDLADTPQVFLSDGKQAFSFYFWDNLPRDVTWSNIATADVDRNGCSDLIVPIDNSDSVRFFYSDCKSGFREESKSIFVYKLKDVKLLVHLTRGLYKKVLACSNLEPRFCLFSQEDTAVQQKKVKLYPQVLKPLLGRFTQTENTSPIFPWTWQYDFRMVMKVSIGVMDKWAFFDGFQDWDDMFVGDFNGDGLEDLLTHNNSLYGWWVAFSYGKGTVELNASFGREQPINPHELLVSDYNGDGLSDIAELLPSSRVVRIYSLKNMPLSGANIYDNHGNTVISDENGYYQIKSAVENPITLNVSKEGYLFVLKHRKVNIQINDLRSKVNFVAITNGQDGGKEAGKSFDLAEPLSGPFVCLGYNLGKGQWNWASIFDECPSGYAVLSTLVPNISSESAAREDGLNISCCRLPASDILTEEKIDSDLNCPDNFIATGIKYSEKLKIFPTLICTKINLARYQLSTPKEGVVFGFSSRRPFWKEKRYTRYDLPLAIRYGLGRTSINSWQPNSCVAYPWGGVLTGKGVGGCRDRVFKQLQYVGASGDPSSGTPVKMFPDCKKISNIYDPRSGCVLNEN